ncbi:MAG: DNA cytosine methyltransferase, partial [Candidatus Tectomicrobia bacterium]|nr:DNA cytosine methyltransferase [Candidatus Tectomicrobia bacterium]
MTALILSIFPGIDLLGRAFEEAGFCVVRGPDLITGGDIRTFHVPSGKFAGVIGGPPCQDFSRLNRSPGRYGAEMLREYVRIVTEAQPDWFLFENVLTAPDVRIAGYPPPRFALDLAWFSPFSRRRDFVFGSRYGVRLDPMNGVRGAVEGTCVTGSDGRSYAACCKIQGVPGLQLPFFTQAGKKQAIANAVPMAMGRYVASLIAQAVYGAKASATS